MDEARDLDDEPKLLSLGDGSLDLVLLLDERACLPVELGLTLALAFEVGLAGVLALGLRLGLGPLAVGRGIGCCFLGKV